MHSRRKVAVAPLLALLAVLGLAVPAHSRIDTRTGATSALDVLVATPVATGQQHHPDLPTAGVLATRPVAAPSLTATHQVDDVAGAQPSAQRTTAANRAPPALQVTR